jgi:hypothetical protein
MTFFVELFFIYLIPLGIVVLGSSGGAPIEYTIGFALLVMFASMAWFRKPWKK